MVALPKLLLLRMALLTLVVGLPALFAPTATKKVLEKMVKNHDLVRIWGVLALLVGFLFLLVQYVFNGTWYIVFAIFGRASLLKGIVYIWFPSFIERKIKIRTSSTSMMRVMGIGTVIMAAFLTWVALAKI